MKIRYLSPNELSVLLLRDSLPDDIAVQRCIGVCSIADFVDFCERQKKSEFAMTPGDMEARFVKVCDNGSTDYGAIGIAELEADVLFDALFDESGDFWADAVDSKIPPTHSIRMLSLRPSPNVYWDNDTYNEMITALTA